MSSSDPAILIADACVLIDYAKAGHIGICSRVAREYLPLLVPVFSEVSQLDRDDAARLGIRIVEPSSQQLRQVWRGGPLSQRDKLCCIMAQQLQGAVWSSDRSMQKHCEKLGIPFYWGLQIMLCLVERRLLTVGEAIAIASDIQAVNPTHITVDVLQTFKQKVQSL